MRPFRLPARIGVFGEAHITLQQALAMALANNKDIEASRIDREIAGYNLTGARGLYDPTVGAVSQFLKQVNPVASSLGGSATGAVLNRTWQTDPTRLRLHAVAGRQLSRRFQFAARLHQQHLRHAESAVSQAR